MFKRLVSLLTVAVAGLFWGSSAFAQGITGSAHDFTDDFSTGDLCVVCHAPHDNQNAAGDLLWNHDPSLNEGSFVPYSSLSLDGTSGQPSGVSLLCLGCHDGTVGADAYGGATGTAANTVGGANFPGVPPFGAELGNDHPIAISYPLTADGELQPFNNAVTFADTSTGDTDDLLFGTAGQETQTVECGSCHDVHDTVSNGVAGLLVIDNTNSALCFACHNK